jgi:hypothetical protein
MRYVLVTPYFGRAALGVHNVTGTKPLAFFSSSRFYQHEKIVQQMFPETPFEYTDTPRGEYAYENIPEHLQNIDLVVLGEPFLYFENQVAHKKLFDENWPEWETFVERCRSAITKFKPKVLLSEIPYRLYREGSELNRGAWDAQRLILNALRSMDYSMTIFLTSPWLHGTPDRARRCFLIAWHAKHAPIVRGQVSLTPAYDMTQFLLNYEMTEGQSRIECPTPEFSENPYIRYASTVYGEYFNSKYLSIQSRLISEGRLGDFGHWLAEQVVKTKQVYDIGEITFDILNRNSPSDVSPKTFSRFTEIERPVNFENVVHPYYTRFLTVKETLTLLGFGQRHYEVVKNAPDKIGLMHKDAFKTAPFQTYYDLAVYIQRVIAGEGFRSDTDYYVWNNIEGARARRRKPRYEQ